MPMCAKGMTKLIEECGELVQALGKKLAYYDTDEHPDGGPPLSRRLEDEMADVSAAIEFVADKLRLDWNRIWHRRGEKRERFEKWDAIPDNNDTGVDARKP